MIILKTISDRFGGKAIAIDELDSYLQSSANSARTTDTVDSSTEPES